MSSIEAELFDGTVLEFPEGTDPAVIQRVVKEQTAAKRGSSMGTTAAPSNTAPSLQQRVEDVIGGPSPMADPAAADTPEMRDASGGLTLEDVIMGLGGVVDQGVRGVAEGVTNIVGLPQAVATLQRNVGKWGMEQMGAPEAAVDVLDYITPLADIAPSAEGMQAGIDAANNATADALGVERPRAAPENMPERFANRVGEELGAMLIPGAVVANRMKNAGRGIAAIDPGAFWSKEATVATGAGTGAAIANEVAPDSPIADLFGALAGAGTVAVGGPLVRSVADVGSAIFQRDNFVDQVVNDAVVDRIGKAANLPGADTPEAIFDTKTLVDAMDDPARRRPSDLIPGYRETLSDRTGNAGIASLEYGRAAGVNAGQYNDLRMRNNEAVDAAMRGIEPQETPGTFRDAVSTQRDQQLLDLIMGQEMAARQAEEATRAITPTTTPAQRGGTVREGLETARDAARARTEEAYNQVNIAGRQVDPAPLKQGLDEAVNSLTEVERGLVPQGVIDRVRKLGTPLEDGPQNTGILDASGNPITRPPQGPAPVSLKEATDLKSELQRLQRAAQATPREERGGRNAARVIGQMIDTVDGFISSNLDEADRAALDAARGTKFDEAERFTRQGDPVARALGRYEGGQPQVADDRVAGLFVNPQAMDRLFAQADTPDVRAAIRDEVLSKGDTSKADRITNFLDSYGEQIDRFPGLRDEITRAAEARGAEAAATTSRQTFEKIYGTPGNERGTGTVGKYLQFGDEQSERAISQVLSSKDPAKAADELVNFVGNNPRALEGARSAFWQKLKTESQSTDNAQRSMSGKRQWRGDWLKSWLDDPSTAAVAERLYKDKPEDLEKLRAYADVLDNADLRVRGKASGTSGTSQGVSNIMTPETIQSRTYAWMRGQISGTYLATSMAAVFARRAVRGARADAIERLTDKVLLNPELAKELLKDNNPANRAALARKAKGWLGNQAATTLEILNEDDSEDGEMKSTIMREKN
jgi:hypothetical protein